MKDRLLPAIAIAFVAIGFSPAQRPATGTPAAPTATASAAAPVHTPAASSTPVTHTSQSSSTSPAHTQSNRSSATAPTHQNVVTPPATQPGKRQNPSEPTPRRDRSATDPTLKPLPGRTAGPTRVVRRPAVVLVPVSAPTPAGVNGDSGVPTLIVEWPTAMPIQQGQDLGAALAGGSANVPGIFIYSPGLGFVPPSGLCDVSITFIPDDQAHYVSPTTTVAVSVQ
jgi:hypothetical protein